LNKNKEYRDQIEKHIESDTWYIVGFTRGHFLKNYKKNTK